MRKTFFLALAVSFLSVPVSALEPWPTVVDRSVIDQFRLQPDYDQCSADLVNGTSLALTDHFAEGPDGMGGYRVLVVNQKTTNRYKPGSMVKMKFGNKLAWGKVVAAKGDRTTFAFGAALLRDLWFDGELPFIEFEGTQDLFDQEIYDMIVLYDPEGKRDTTLGNRQLISALLSCYEGLSMGG